MKHKYNFKPVKIAMIIGTIAAITLFSLTSCEPNNDTECDKLTHDYMQAIQFAKTQEQVDELTRQYQQRISKLNC